MHHALKIVVATGGTTAAAAAAFSPLSLFAGGETGFWYDGADNATLWQDAAGTTASADTEVVGKWDDKDGGVATNATQATTANKPTNQAGGLLNFDGVDDYLNSSFVLGTSGSVFARVVVPASAAAPKYCAGTGTTGTKRAWLGVTSAGLANASIGSTAISGAVNLFGTTAVIGLTWDGTTVTLYVNGSSVNSGAQGSNTAGTNAIWVGGFNSAGTLANPWPSDISDVLVTNDVLTPTEVADLNTYWSA